MYWTKYIFLLTIAIDLTLCKLRREKNICYTSQCIRMNRLFLDHLNFSVDPCEDFYEFSCGNFLSNTDIPDDQTSISLYSDIADLLDDQLRDALDEPIQPNEPNAFGLAKKFYQACLNTDVIEEIGSKEIKGILRKLGGWPVLEGDNWKAEDFDWKRSIGIIGHEGFYTDYFFNFGIEPDSKNTTRRTLYLDEAVLGLDRVYLVDPEEAESYYDYMVDIAVILGADRKTAKEELQESFEFEIKLAEITLPDEERQDPSALYHPMTIADLQVRNPSIPWLQYFNGILTPDVTVTEDDVVVVYVPEYISKFETLIRATSKRIQANYLLWRVVKSSVYYLTEKLRTRRFEFYAASTGKVSQSPRWKNCVSTTGFALPVAVGALYVRRYFDQSSKDGVEKIVSNIQAEFRKILQNVPWMDDQTRESALEKLNGMQTQVAYPDELMDDTKLDQHYSRLEVDSGHYWKSLLNIYKFDDKYSYSRYHLPVNKTDWVDYSATFIVDAFYQSLRNVIHLPAGHLQGFFFHKNNPNYINYGGVGYIVGHEVTHGFDNQGRNYDKDGNLMNWWANTTTNAYNEKASCIIDQYNNFRVEEIGMNVNGVTTLDENIADIAGIKQAYLAYVKLIRKHGEDKRLPSFRRFNGRQMYWISTGLSWCVKKRTGALREQVMTNEHPPAKYRLWGSVMNSYEFAKDFHCGPGTNMNPEKKCQIW